ncbi:tetratricopeptide repeat protein [Chryseobacterium foetidum]|uniref:tetratricopeptide repeat protein n=1 Tax=Chryseobacterium foetidum TaxID=2951057 RepID=UPI0021C968A8|nr:tetratricopeptide repeat protein [Chryseobacterium foetidum]
MKKLILGITILASSLSFAQKDDVNAKLQAANKAAMDAFNAKNYAVAAPKFVEVYDLLKASGQDDKTYLYNAAISYAVNNNIPEATKLYEQLIAANYTGEQITYTAKDKKGEVQSFDKTMWTTLKVKSKDYTDFKEEKTPSVEPELYETLATLYLNSKQNDKAVALIEKGLAKFPNNAKLKDFQGTAYYASGNNDKFASVIKEQLAKDPNNAENWYNLGVLQSKNPASAAEAEVSFKKAIELKPDFSNAYLNLVYSIIGDEDNAVKKINEANRTNKAEGTKLIEERRGRFAKALPYAESWYKVQPENIDAVSTLKDIYTVTKNTEKAAALKTKLAELEAKQTK